MVGIIAVVLCVMYESNAFSDRTIPDILTSRMDATDQKVTYFLDMQDLWTTGTAEYAGTSNFNVLRGIGFDSERVIVSGSSPRLLAACSGTDGTHLHNLSMTVVDAYDLDDDGYTTDTWSLDETIGPYDIAVDTSDTIYVNNFAATLTFKPFAKFLDTSTPGAQPVAVARQKGSQRAFDVVNSGSATVLYGNGNTSSWNGIGPVLVYTYATDAKTTFSIFETITGSELSHCVIGRDGNNAGDGDVVWVSANVQNSFKRWERSGGIWTEDTGFMMGHISTTNGITGGDYFNHGGKDYLVVINLGDPQEVIIIEGDTGVVIATWSATSLGKTREFYGGNGDVCISGNRICFGLPDWNIYGMLELRFSSYPVIRVPNDYSTIQGAIDAAEDFWTIIVSPGTYKEMLTIGGKNIVLRSISPESSWYIEHTVIDGEDAHGPLVTFSGTEIPDCILTGFTINHGYTMGDGGGIYGNGTHAILRHCDIVGNTSELPHDSRGGGIFDCDGLIEWCDISYNYVHGNAGGGLANCDGVIRRNVIEGNLVSGCGTQNSGGGLSNCNGIIEENIIAFNYSYDLTAYSYGGGIAGSNALIQNNMIYNNIAANGGGLYDCSSIVRNNTICDNSATTGEGGGLSYCAGTILNNIIWDNTAKVDAQLNMCSTPAYSCIQGWTGSGAGNITDNPFFVDSESDDYHLTMHSRCIDAGTTVPLDSDIDGDYRPYDSVIWETRGDGSNIDIGADEYIGNVPYGVPTPTPTPTPSPTATPTPTPTPSATPTPIVSPTPVLDNTFTDNTEGWTFAGAVPPFETPQFVTGTGFIGLSPAGSTNAFSYWKSPYITIYDGKLYRSRWLVGSSCTNPDSTVQLRLRLTQLGAWQSWSRIISSNMQQAPALTASIWYDVYCSPVVNESSVANLECDFDIMSFSWDDDYFSWLFLEEIVVSESAISQATLVEDYDLTDGAVGWTFAGKIGLFDEPLSSSGTTGLGLSPDGSSNAFSYWLSPDIPIDDGVMYRTRFEIGSSVTMPNNAVQFRTRINQKGSWQGWERVVSSNYEQSPAAGSSKTYDIFFDPDITGTSDSNTVFSFDILSFEPTDDINSWLYLSSIRLEEMSFHY